jgi:hypothetical protein
MAQSTKLARTWLTTAIASILLSGLLFFCGDIVLIGPMLLALAPTFLLLGVASGVVFIAQFFLPRRWMVWTLFGVALVVLGLNTRIPTFARDLLEVDWADERMGQKLAVKVTQAVRIRYDGDPISARSMAYAYASPACHGGEACLVTRGFKTPFDYWSETPELALRDAGLTLADPSERAPTLAVSASKSDQLLIVRLTLSDPAGQPISTARYVYRNGFHAEPADFSDVVEFRTDAAQTSRLAWNFMLHGNFINVLLGRAVAPVTAFPVKHFLARNFDVRSAAEQVGGIWTVALEVLAEKVYAPALEFKGEKGEAPADPWPETGWDAERYQYCDTLLRPESPSAQMEMGRQWWVFARDPTGRRKMRRTSNELCEENAVWSIDYGTKYPHVLIAKYDATGQLQYQVIFKGPAPIGAYPGGIRQKTFHEKDGYVYFEWMNSDRSANRLIVKRKLALRFLIPEADRAK